LVDYLPHFVPLSFTKSPFCTIFRTKNVAGKVLRGRRGRTFREATFWQNVVVMVY
jgi:hypothetical protein